MAGLSLVRTLLYAAGLANIVLGNQQPWLDASLPYEERLQSFIAQLNTTQKLAMTQGDTEVSSPSDFHTNINILMLISITAARRKRHRRKPLHRPHQRQHHPRNPQYWQVVPGTRQYNTSLAKRWRASTWAKAGM
jgi:hypothetical protein